MNRTEHGQSSTRLYKVWAGIKDRCYNPKNPAYRYYGGRGIRMDPRWRDSFVAFVTDIGERPSPRHSIDRRENNGPYSRENCRWATPREQAANCRRHRWLTVDGVTHSVIEWARIRGISEKRIDARLRRGASDSEAVAVDTRKGHPPYRMLTFRGETKPIQQWAAELSISRGVIATRLSRGWSVERALSERP